MCLTGCYNSRYGGQHKQWTLECRATLDGYDDDPITPEIIYRLLSASKGSTGAVVAVVGKRCLLSAGSRTTIR